MIGADQSLQVLLDLTRHLTEQHVSLDEALQLVSDAALTLLRGDHASIRVLEDHAGELLCGARSGAGLDRRPVAFQKDVGVAGWVLEHGETARIDDAADDERFVAFEDQGFTIRSLLAVPLWSAGSVIGCLSVTATQRGAFSREHELIGRLLANCAVPPLERARLQQLAYTDTHTRAFNRTYLHPRLDRELEKAVETERPLSLLMMDLDHFKRVNDAHGHAAGDEVLRVFASRVRGLVRRQDVFVRRGGEEFVLLMPGCDLETAQAAAERIREAIGGDPIHIADDVLVKQTVSIGVACWNRRETGDALERRADDALYAAKRGGRNRVSSIPAPPGATFDPSGSPL